MKVDQQLRTLEVPTGDADVVFGVGMVEFGKTPVNQPELALLVVDHDVVRLDISVHDAPRVAEVEGLEEFGNVEAHIKVVKLGVEGFEVGAAKQKPSVSKANSVL